MPHQLEAFKIAESANINPRRMLIAILISTAIGILVYFWVQLHLYYEKGAASGYFGPWGIGVWQRVFQAVGRLPLLPDEHPIGWAYCSWESDSALWGC